MNIFGGVGKETHIPASNKPSDGKLTLYAKKKSAYLFGEQNILLANDYTI